MTVGELEQAVWKLEGIRIVIRAGTDEHVGDYEYKNAAYGNMSLTNFFRIRIEPKLNGNGFVVIDGSGTQPMAGPILKTCEVPTERSSELTEARNE